MTWIIAQSSLAKPGSSAIVLQRLLSIVWRADMAKREEYCKHSVAREIIHLAFVFLKDEKRGERDYTLATRPDWIFSVVDVELHG